MESISLPSGKFEEYARGSLTPTLRFIALDIGAIGRNVQEVQLSFIATVLVSRINHDAHCFPNRGPRYLVKMMDSLSRPPFSSEARHLGLRLLSRCLALLCQVEAYQPLQSATRRGSLIKGEDEGLFDSSFDQQDQQGEGSAPSFEELTHLIALQVVRWLSSIPFEPELNGMADSRKGVQVDQEVIREGLRVLLSDFGQSHVAEENGRFLKRKWAAMQEGMDSGSTPKQGVKKEQVIDQEGAQIDGSEEDQGIAKAKANHRQAGVLLRNAIKEVWEAVSCL